MKAYISGALMGSKDIVKSRLLYEKIGEFCSSIGIKPYIPHLNTDPEFNFDYSDKDVFEKDFNHLTTSHIMICYLGEPSLGVGAEIVFAIENNLQIVTILESNNKASRFVLGLLDRYNKHNIIRYSDTTDLKNKLEILLVSFSEIKTAYNSYAQVGFSSSNEK